MRSKASDRQHLESYRDRGGAIEGDSLEADTGTVIELNYATARIGFDGGELLGPFLALARYCKKPGLRWFMCQACDMEGLGLDRNVC